MPTINIKLCCWQCGATKPIKTSRIPSFAFEAAELAHSNGWIGIIDYRHHRSIVLCSEACEAKVKTKDGNIRKYPLKP